MMSTLKQAYRSLKEIFVSTSKLQSKFKSDYDTFVKTGNTSQAAYQNFIRLYCKTNGAFNEEMHNNIKSAYPKKEINTVENSVLGNKNTKDFSRINQELLSNGYSFFEEKLNTDKCNSLIAYALNTRTTIPPKYDTQVIYDPKNKISEIYRFDMNDLMNNQIIQELIMDPALINIARNYLDCEPIFDFPAMWWSTDYLKESSAEAAQQFHFDLDRLKWLKIFIYLTPVNESNGPHCYVEGSHQVGAKPRKLLNRGYARIPDKDIEETYGEKSIKYVQGEQGAMFAGDTKCWHKGTNLKEGHRLVLEFEYTSSMFGANYPKLQVDNISTDFRTFCQENPHYTSNIILK